MKTLSSPLASGLPPQKNKTTQSLVARDAFRRPPFGLGQKGPWYASVAPENKYLFNGIERDTDWGLNLDMADFRAYDPTVGRWWQVDPKGEAFLSVSSYNSMLNNPLLNVDPKGDTTRIYSLEGELLKTINDSHSNQEHFLTYAALALLEGAGQESDKNMNGSLARVLSSFFIGSNTREELSNIYAKSEEEGLERHFLLVRGEDSKEIQIADITQEGTERRTNKFVQLKAGSILRGLTPKGTSLIGFGHTHPASALHRGGDVWGLRTPTTQNGYPDYDNHLGLKSPAGAESSATKKTQSLLTRRRRVFYSVPRWRSVFNFMSNN